MKKLCSILLFITLFLTGCAKTPQITYPIVGDTYIIQKEGDKVYFDFTKPPSGDTQIAGVSFANLNEMYRKLTTAQLSERELVQIYKACGKDANGRIQIVDLNRLYEPENPLLRNHRVKMEGNGYNIWASYDSDRDIDGSLSILFGLSFKNDYKKELEERDDWYAANSQYQVTKIKERNATEYATETKKTLRYTLKSWNKEFHVFENYNLEENQETPYRIYVYVNDDRWFHVSIELIGDEKRPTEEFLMSLGIQPFVPENAADPAA